MKYYVKLINKTVEYVAVSRDKMTRTDQITEEDYLYVKSKSEANKIIKHFKEKIHIGKFVIGEKK